MTVLMLSSLKEFAQAIASFSPLRTLVPFKTDAKLLSALPYLTLSQSAKYRAVERNKGVTFNPYLFPLQSDV